MVCTFDESINTCPNYDRDNKQCTTENTVCCFARKEEEANKDKYVRKEKWFEKYYK